MYISIRFIDNLKILHVKIMNKANITVVLLIMEYLKFLIKIKQIKSKIIFKKMKNLYGALLSVRIAARVILRNMYIKITRNK